MKKIVLASLCLGMFTVSYCPLFDWFKSAPKEVKDPSKNTIEGPDEFQVIDRDPLIDLSGRPRQSVDTNPVVGQDRTVTIDPINDPNKNNGSIVPSSDNPGVTMGDLAERGLSIDPNEPDFEVVPMSDRDIPGVVVNLNVAKAIKEEKMSIDTIFNETRSQLLSDGDTFLTLLQEYSDVSKEALDNKTRERIEANKKTLEFAYEKYVDALDRMLTDGQKETVDRLASAIYVKEKANLKKIKEAALKSIEDNVRATLPLQVSNDIDLVGLKKLMKERACMKINELYYGDKK